MDANLSKILNKLNIIFQKFTINQIIYLVFGFFVFIGAIMYFHSVSPKLN